MIRRYLTLCRRPIGLGLALLVLSLCLGRVASAHAQSPGTGLRLQATAGWDGYYKDRRWLPVVVELSNTGASVEAVVVVEAGAAYDGTAHLYQPDAGQFAYLVAQDVDALRLRG